MKFRNRAFTLIELLVVIAIIGILAGVVIASLNAARSKARDAKRFSDLKSLQTALEMYYADNGSYPSTGLGFRGNCSGYGSHALTGSGGYIPNLAPQYIPVLPQENKTNTNCYLYRSDGSDYIVLAEHLMENPVPDALKRPSVPTATGTAAVYSSGGKGW